VGILLETFPHIQSDTILKKLSEITTIVEPQHPGPRTTASKRENYLKKQLKGKENMPHTHS
jgi:hypothetical protein